MRRVPALLLGLLLLMPLLGACGGAEEAVDGASPFPGAASGADVDPDAPAIAGSSASDAPDDGPAAEPTRPVAADDGEDGPAADDAPVPAQTTSATASPSSAASAPDDADPDVVWTEEVPDYGTCTAYEDGRMDCTEQEFDGSWIDCGVDPSFCFEGDGPPIES